MKVCDPFELEHYPLLIIITGPAGAGKDAVIEALGQRGQPFHFVVTATDRPPRPGEVDGVDYHFVTSEEFARMIEEGELLEHAIVYGQNKGIPKQEVREGLQSGLDAVLRIDVQGARTMQQLVPDAVFIFVMPPSESELELRLRRRGCDSEEQIQRRLGTAREEMAQMTCFGYVVVNYDGCLEQAVDDVLAIIRAEHRRIDQRLIVI